MKSTFVRNALEYYLLIQGTFLLFLSIMHIGIALTCLLVNGISIYIRRSAFPLILFLLTLPVLPFSLYNALFFDSWLPLLLACASIPLSIIPALLIQQFLTKRIKE